MRVGWVGGVVGDEWTAIMADMDRLIMPGLTHWEASNRFFAYFKPHSSFPAVLGELMCAGLNVMGFDWVASPAATELEVVTVDWLARLLRLPERFRFATPGPGGGVFQESAGSAATVALLAAIKRAQDVMLSTLRRERGDDATCDGDAEDAEAATPRSRMVVYGSDQTHTIVKKACMILGVGTYRELPTRSEDHWALQPDTLRAAVERDVRAGLVPVACVATAGTTSSCAFDPIAELADVCSEEIGPAGPLWLHIDAAYVAARGLHVTDCTHSLSGAADARTLAGTVAPTPASPSLTTCSRAWVTKASPPSASTATRSSCAPSTCLCCTCRTVAQCYERCPSRRSTSAIDARLCWRHRRCVRHDRGAHGARCPPCRYLRNAASDSGAVVDFEHWQLPLGRRFRALKLWFVLRRFGAEAVRGHLRAGLRLRRVVEAAVRDDALFELEPSAPPSLSLVCFRLRGVDNDGQRAFLAAVKATGRCFIIHTSLGDRVVLRFACGGLEQTEADVMAGWGVIASVAREMLTSGAISSSAGSSV